MMNDAAQQDGGTQMRFHQALLAELGHRDHHEEGWKSAFDGIAGYIE